MRARRAACDGPYVQIVNGWYTAVDADEGRCESVGRALTRAGAIALLARHRGTSTEAARRAVERTQGRLHLRPVRTRLRRRRRHG